MSFHSEIVFRLYQNWLTFNPPPILQPCVTYFSNFVLGTPLVRGSLHSLSHTVRIKASILSSKDHLLFPWPRVGSAIPYFQSQSLGYHAPPKAIPQNPFSEPTVRGFIYLLESNNSSSMKMNTIEALVMIYEIRRHRLVHHSSQGICLHDRSKASTILIPLLQHCRRSFLDSWKPRTISGDHGFLSCPFRWWEETTQLSSVQTSQSGADSGNKRDF